MVQEIKYAELAITQKHFLNNYFPKNSMFTTTMEMKQIISKLGLDETSDIERLRAIRNSVVHFYRIVEKTTGYNKMESLQSVTSVIDHQMHKLNPMSI